MFKSLRHIRPSNEKTSKENEKVDRDQIEKNCTTAYDYTVLNLQTRSE